MLYAAANSESKVNPYPERLLVYHAPVLTTVWVGFGKALTVFVLAYGCLLVAPAIYYNPEYPAWMTPAGIAVHLSNFW